MEFGVAIKPIISLEKILEIAKICEKINWSYVMVDDETPSLDVWVTLAAISKETRKVILGPSVTNPFSRHPLVTGVATVTLDKLSCRRCVLGIASGANRIVEDCLGLDYSHHLGKLKESLIIIRDLMERGEVDRKMKFYSAKASLQKWRKVPIWIGGVGENAIKLAKDFGDIYFGIYYPERSYLSYVLNQVKKRIPVALWMPVFFDFESAKTYAEFRFRIMPQRIKKFIGEKFNGDLIEKLVFFGKIDELSSEIRFLEDIGVEKIIFGLPLGGEDVLKKMKNFTKLKFEVR